MTTIGTQVTIGNTVFSPERWNVRGGTYGSVGTAEIFTSRLELARAGLDLSAQAIANNGFLQCLVSVSVDGRSTAIFGGEYVHADWDFDTDAVEIFARDWAGVLVDEKRVLNSIASGVVSILAPGEVSGSSGVQNQSQTVANIVRQVATQFGFKAVINNVGSIDPNAFTDPDTLIGSTYGDDPDQSNYVPIPQPLWNILCRLARDTGNEIYVTPAKQLVFGAPGAGRPTIGLSWNIMPPAGITPVRSLHIQHNPRRNMSFRVAVGSYDPARAQHVYGNAYVIGTKLPGANGQSINPGLWPGTNSQIPNQLKAAGQRIQLYSFHIDGLTQAQAEQRAMSIAYDIAKREFIMTAQMDGMPDITPLQTMKIQGDIDQAFAARDFYVQSFTHTYEVSASGAPGFNTIFSALDIQAFGVGSELTQ